MTSAELLPIAHSLVPLPSRPPPVVPLKGANPA